MYLVRNFDSSQRLPPVLSGLALAHRKLDARQRAAIAAQAYEAEIGIDLSLRQLCMLLGVSAPYVRVARSLSPEKRAAIAGGSDPASFVPLLASPKLPALPAPVSDAKLAEVIRDAGLDRILAVAIEVEGSTIAA
jgi:hypothetical protein